MKAWSIRKVFFEDFIRKLPVIHFYLIYLRIIYSKNCMIMKLRLSVVTLFALFAVMLCSSASAQSDSLKKIEGKWTFSMPDMNGGTIDGSCVIATVEGATKATFTSPMGDISTNPLTLKDGKYVGELSFEGEAGTFTMKVSFEPKGDKLMYGVSSEYGEMPPLEMTRAK
jgi:hypothetical protein